MRNGYKGGGGVTHLQSFTINLYISRILLPQKLTSVYETTLSYLRLYVFLSFLLIPYSFCVRIILF